jgi:signal transduction histidine kinase
MRPPFLRIVNVNRVFFRSTLPSFGNNQWTMKEKQFAQVLREELSPAEYAAHIRSFNAGQLIFAAGDVGDGLFVIETGRVQISAVVNSGEPRPLASIGPGDFFGEMAVIDDSPRSATAVAETDASAFYLSREEMMEMLNRHPGLTLTLIREFSNRMRATNLRYLDEIIQGERLALVGRSARTIVHDFKNPLVVIRLAAEVTGATTTTTVVRQKARDSILRQVDRMSYMLNELIEYARPSGRQPSMSTVNFAPYLNSLVEDSRSELAEGKVTLELETPPPEIEVLIEAPRLSRVFYNLVHNAMDEMREGGKITLRFTVRENELVVEMQDTGKGIAPEILPQLFQPFATHGKAQGTGLGLSICKRIIEDHGGRIWARSDPGKGATFSFALPLPEPR